MSRRIQGPNVLRPLGLEVYIHKYINAIVLIPNTILSTILPIASPCLLRFYLVIEREIEIERERERERKYVDECIILGCRESVFLSQTCFYNSALSYKRETKTVKCRGVISTEQNESYVIRKNNIKQRTLCVYYFLIKRKKPFGQPNRKIYLSKFKYKYNVYTRWQRYITKELRSPWVYGYLYNYGKTGQSVPRCIICARHVPRKLWGWEALQIDLVLNNTQWLPGLRKLNFRKDVEFS